ncbi:MAG: amino acid adenylation domain-containing protein [Acidobacteriaceae bacterium]|nr:amino acid adenylation domain-containing protein [Acidobacteriaceae bacterium]
MKKTAKNPLPEQSIAIIGMAGRFPGAASVEQFWQNILAGKDTVTHFTAKPGDVAPDFVAARGVLPDVDLFDAEFFSVTPHDAERMDPQHRVLLEVAEQALENAGYSSHRYADEIGLYAGCSLNTYLLNNLCGDRAALEKLAANYQVGEFATALGNDKDFLTTRIAYKLNLRGPAVTVQSACATSLVAIAQAAQSLLNYQCSMALAGGVSITFPQERGYIAQEGSLMSADGTCRPFDAAASGTVFGHGAAMVLLKRLEDAVADGDTVYAVLRGFAVTNDGAEKVGYMAPGINGQVRALQGAQGMAGVEAASISYVEAHGTGTPLGDPVEFSALSQVFGTSEKRWCTIGSAKANVGHLDAAAGATGVIKTVMQLHERTLPGLAHFRTPNPHLPMENSPFRFIADAKPWASEGPLRAGVSAFGVGGVNAHVVLEEAPAMFAAAPVQRALPLVLSARTPEALAAMRLELATFLQHHAELNLEDIAWTLADGRTFYKHRAAVVVSTREEAIASLQAPISAPVLRDAAEASALAWLGGDETLLANFFASIEPAQRIALPTYPFERKRFWIEAQPSLPASAAPQAAVEAVPASQDRLPALRRRVAEELHKVSGVTITSEEDEVSFLELGLDSLCMTQAAQVLTKSFGAAISFRQLMESDDSVEKLASYLDGVLPQEAAAPAGNSVVGAALEQQIAQLNSIFAGQIDELRKLAGMEPLAKAAATARPVPNAAALGEVKHGSFRTIQKVTHATTPEQTAYLEALIAKYVQKTPGSKRHTAESRSFLADPRAVAGFRPQWKEMVYPLVTDRAKGSRIIDVDGNEYIDIVNGYGCIMFGHSPEFVVNAAMEQMNKGVAIGPQSVLAGEVAKLFADMTGNERVTFCNTGSEAVMAAIRLARTITGRDRVVYFAGDYHGTFDEVLVRQTPAGSMPIAPGIPFGNVGNVTVLEYGTPESLEWLRANANDLAAVLIEPVQTRHPEVQPFEFIREVRKLTEAADATMILDEVVTGFRVAPGGIQEYLGIRADLCTYGKVVGGGYPVGVLSGKAKWMDALDGGAWHYGDASTPEVGMTFFAGTFVRHPQALAIARAVLQHLNEHGPAMQQTLNEKTAAMMGEVNAMFAERNVPFRVYGFASWFYVSFPSEWKMAPLFYYAMRARGVHIQEGYPCFLTTVHSDADIVSVLQAFRETIAELHGLGILPTGEAEAIAAASQSNTPALAPKLQREIPSSVPLTEPQREIFLAASLDDAANCAFNESVTLELRGAVREDALRFALDAAVARHDALRSTVDEAGEMLQVSPAFEGEIEFADLSAFEADARLQAVASRRNAEAVQPFDLHRGPLLRVICFRQSAEHFTVLLTAHHIVLDGWSANVLLEEVAAIYSGGAKALESLPTSSSFAGYALHESERTAAGEFRANEAYWVERFRGRTPRLNLPTDRPRPALRGFAGATYRGTVPTGIFEAVRAAARKSGASPYVAFLSSFQMLMHRLTQQDEVVVGISTAGQALLEGETLVGHCVHFLPMLSELREGETVAAHWKATRTAMLDAQGHQEYTFGSLLRELDLPRDSSRMPLIEVQFNLEKLGEGMNFEGLTAIVSSNAKRFVNTDLFLNVMETPAGIEFTCDYNTDLFDGATIERWMEIWKQLLQSVSASPEELVVKLPLLPVAQREQVLEAWNRTATDFGAFQSMPQIIAHYAAERPSAVAIECNGHAWTYRELHAFVQTIAQRMKAEGVKPGDIIGISLDRSVELLGAMLAVMAVGAAYVPLDANNPQERLNLIMSDAQMTLLLTGRDPKIVSSIRRINVTGPQPSHTDEVLPTVVKSDLAYLLYTSGSTGKPKGVAIDHNALMNLLHSMMREPGFTAADTMLAVTTISFDIAELELLMPLLAGGRVVIATDEEARDGAMLLGLLRRTGANVMQATPGLWRVLLDAGWSSDLKLKVLCGGEALPRELAAQLVKTSTDVWNMYGPTETTIWSSTLQVQRGDETPRIGGPIANTTFYVLDSTLQPLPLGVPGDLYIGGDGLARGYWHRDDLTSAAFLANPFGEGRLYRTGDLGRWCADGTIALSGRGDSQVKIRGYRIELGEIEAAFRGQPGVAQAVVAQQAATETASAFVVAFVQMEPGHVAEASDLRVAAQRVLPEYMQPRDIVLVDAMPQTANGKIDRKALLTNHRAQAAPRAMVLPSNEREAKLVAIWQELLERKEVSTVETIFELGADSLTVFRMAARCQREGLPLRAAQILALRTIQAIAASLPSTEQPIATSATTTPKTIRAVSRQNYILRKDS